MSKTFVEELRDRVRSVVVGATPAETLRRTLAAVDDEPDGLSRAICIVGINAALAQLERLED